MNPLNNAALFLINTIVDLYLLVLVIRLILAYSRADYFNPVTQMVIKITQPIVAPLRRYVPNYRGIEFSTLIWIFIIEIAKFILIGFLTLGMPNLLGLLVLAFADALKLILNTFFYAILLQAILSWVQPGFSPMGQLLANITAPIMRPLHRFVPPVGGFDISPIFAMILVQLLIILIATPLLTLGIEMSFQ